MPKQIDPETVYVDDLPGIWSPVQWELSEVERIREVEQQATASLLWAVNAPEAILRLLLDECAIERAFNPPSGYDAAEQGDWNPDLISFTFKRRIHLEKVERSPDRLYIEYKLDELGTWALEIEPDFVSIYRL
jgi:hypothetical protein